MLNRSWHVFQAGRRDTPDSYEHGPGNLQCAARHAHPDAGGSLGCKYSSEGSRGLATAGARAGHHAGSAATAGSRTGMDFVCCTGPGLLLQA